LGLGWVGCCRAAVGVFVSTRSEELSQFEQVYVEGVGKGVAGVFRVDAGARVRAQVNFGQLVMEPPLAGRRVSLVDVEYGGGELAQVAWIAGGLRSELWFGACGR